jgi:putative MATE family efflux protein
MVFVSLIGSVDVMMVSDLGYQAVAAVGLAGQPRMVTLAMFFALNVGVTAVVARRKGQQLPDDANQTLRNGLIVGFLLSLVVTVPAMLFSEPLMLFAGADPVETLNMSNTYFKIMTAFLPVNVLTMTINAAQRGAGNTRMPMIANLVANVVNVIFNYLLIYGKFGFPRMEVAGNAISSGIGMCVALILSLLPLIAKKKNDNRFLRFTRKDNWRIHWNTLFPVVKVGGNAMVEQGAQRIGFMAYAIIVAKLGTAHFAAHQAGMQFLNFSFTFGDGIGIAATSLVGQNLGRKRSDLALLYGKCGQRLALTVSVIVAALVVSFRYPLVKIFLNPALPNNMAAYLLGVDLMFMVACFQPLQMSNVVISGCLRGAGDNLYVATVMILCVMIVRPVMATIAIALGFGLMGAWAGAIIDMGIRLALMYKRFSSDKWMTKVV